VVRPCSRPWRPGPGVSTLFAEGKAATNLMGSWEDTRQFNQNLDFATTKLA